MRRAQTQIPCTQTASAVPKYFPCLLQFCTGYRIWHASRAWKQKKEKKRKERKTFIFMQLKLSRCNPHFFAIFRRILRNWGLWYAQLVTGSCASKSTRLTASRFSDKNASRQYLVHRDSPALVLSTLVSPTLISPSHFFCGLFRLHRARARVCDKILLL